MTLDDLIAAIEAGTAHNEDVARALGGTPDEDGEFWLTPDDWPGPSEQRLPDWLGSLDAAAGLVPAGWEWMVSNRAPAPRAGRAYIHNREMKFIGGGLTPNPKYRGFENTAPLPAAALTIAALRARAAG